MRTGGSARFAALAAGAMLGLMLASGPASAAPTIGGFGVRPAHPSSQNPATRAYFIIHARPGSTQNEAVVVTNPSAEPLLLAVNGVDGLTGVTSGVVYANRGVPARGAGAWVTPEARRVTVPARSSINVRFALRTPHRSAAGDHLAGIAFEALHPTKSGGNFSVTVIVRTVVGVEIIVPGRVTRHLRLDRVLLAPLPGTTVPSAVVTLENTGQQLCHPKLAVALSGQTNTATATQTLGTILPRDKIAYPFRWPAALASGRYAVRVRATRCGPPETIHTIAAYSLTGPATSVTTGSQPTVAATAPLATTANNWPWWLIALIAAASMTIGVVLTRITRGRRNTTR
jgi:Bacterial protein of unknown function (DUF916)